MTVDPSAEPASGAMGRGVWFRALLISPDGIYGLVIVAGMIVVSSNLTASSGEALISVVTTLLVFFAAHVYAVAISHMARGADGGHGWLAAIGHGIRESAGMMVAGAVPVLFLLLGFLGILRDADAVWLALGVDVVLLGLLGWLIAAMRTSSVWVRIVSMLVTALFGGVLIALKAFVHH